MSLSQINRLSDITRVVLSTARKAHADVMRVFKHRKVGEWSNGVE
jgi:hypothetical protein